MVMMAFIKGWQYTRSIPWLSLFSVRQFSTGGTDFISLSRDKDIAGLAIATLQKKPVNTFCQQHLQELDRIITDVEKDESIRALIITSAFPGVFSAGFDLNSFYKKEPWEICEFWRCFQDSFLRLYASRLITVAAVNGHSPAFGCAIALGCDYRIMAAGSYKIGLTVVHLGMQPPFGLRELLGNTIGKREAEKAVQLGTLYESDEAYKIGLVDEVVPMDDMLPASKQQVTKWLSIPDHARVSVKKAMRGELVKKVAPIRDEEMKMAASMLTQPNVQELLGKALARLKKKASV